MQYVMMKNITANRYRNVWKYIWTSIIYTGKQKFFMDGNALLEKGMLAEFDALFLDVEFGGKAQGMKIAREVHQRNCNASDCICVGIY